MNIIDHHITSVVIHDFHPNQRLAALWWLGGPAHNYVHYGSYAPAHRNVISHSTNKIYISQSLCWFQLFRLCFLFRRPECCSFVNYRFSSCIFSNECPSYVTENGTRTGCLLPYNSKTDRFSTFCTLLQYGNSSHKQELELKSKGELIRVPGWHREFERTMFCLGKWKTMQMCIFKTYLYVLSYSPVDLWHPIQSS